jgi:hemerythrin-like metal-binding protein
VNPLQWTPALAVGHATIDEQHQELFRRGERLITALRAGHREEIVPTLAYLEEYAIHHFELEERLMRELRYPGLAEHAAAHKAFREDFAEMMKGFHRSGPTSYVALTVHNWLSGWLRSHLGGVDLELGRFLADRAR